MSEVASTMAYKESQYFSQFPFLETILKSSDYQAVPMWARTRKAGGADAFFSDTLGTDSTIPECTMLKLKSLMPLAERTKLRLDTTFSGSAKAGPKTIVPLQPDTITLLSLSSPGICSHPSTAHGGVICTVLDEVMVHTLLSRFSTNSDTIDKIRGSLFTAELQVRLKAPVRTPGVLVVKSWCVAHSGRKYWMKAEASQWKALGVKTHRQEVIKSEAFALLIKVDSKL